MEDEECLPEDSGLNNYLQNLGFTDVEVTKKIVPNSSSIRFGLSDTKNKRLRTEVIDEDVIDQIRIIVSTQMLFEEDILFIENLLSHFEVIKSGFVKCMFKNLFGIAVIFIGLCFYWVIGYSALILVSTFYAYNAANYLRRRYYYRIRLKKLSSVIQGNYFLLKRSIKFIEESKLIESKYISIENSREFIEGFDNYKNFKGDLSLSINEIINVFIKSTQKLIHKVPLYDYIENHEYCLCNNYKKNDDSLNLSRLFEIYLLLQSEFLKRLILSLIPNLQLSFDANFNEVNKILGETYLSLLKIKKTCSTKFKFIFLNGIHSLKTPTEFKLPKKQGFSDNPYKEEFHLNIHEVSKSFQNLLLRCRILEENIKSEKMLVYSDMENELTEMLSYINSCQKIMSDCLILLNKLNVTNKCNTGIVLEKREIDKANETLSKIEVGYTNLDPKVEDEIFEMCLASEKADKNFSDIDEWELSDRSGKKLRKEYCKNMMKELKVRLAEKAQYWRKREKELLKKKGLNDAREDLLECESNSTDEENEDDLDFIDKENMPLEAQEFVNCKSDFKMPVSPKKEKVQFELENFTLESQKDLQDHEKSCLSGTCKVATNAEDEFKTFQEESANSENTENQIGVFKTDFFNDLNKARKKIFKSSSTAEEELFCDSDESITS